MYIYKQPCLLSGVCPFSNYILVLGSLKQKDKSWVMFFFLFMKCLKLPPNPPRASITTTNGPCLWILVSPCLHTKYWGSHHGLVVSVVDCGLTGHPFESAYCQSTLTFSLVVHDWVFKGLGLAMSVRLDI